MARLYVGDLGPVSICERHDVLADNPRVSAHRPLTCRWPDQREISGVILFCHGLGSNGGEYVELSSYWARRGYLVIHPTFADSIDRVARAEPALGLDPDADLTGWSALPSVRARMHEILHAPSSWLARVALTAVVMDALEDIIAATVGRQAKPVLCAVAGHSFGAYTAQLLAGAEIDLPDGQTGRFRDPRFAAALLLSAQGRDQQGLRDGSWKAVNVPMLNVTGTLDRGAKGGDWRWKSEPFELSPAGGKYLLVIDEADHFLGGFAPNAGQRRIPAQQEAVKQATLAFFDAHIRGVPAALDWLNSMPDSIAGRRILFRRK
ncbi:MAG: hypothetical protein BGP06_19140 [Rhizobiales bacterium 65-9]|nr:MAG: hypothetical protein BGP06_19140 [Rhizobiales bacterium 65-9]